MMTNPNRAHDLDDEFGVEFSADDEFSAPTRAADPISRMVRPFAPSTMPFWLSRST